MQRLITICFFMATAYWSVAQPERQKGLSLHMLPERVAKLSNEKGGFTVSAPAPKARVATLDANATITYFNNLSEMARKNGIWIVYTDPSSYSDAEKEQLKRLVADCKQKSIPIFTCRAHELKQNGWKASGLIE